jgi:hypothetical protein
MNTITLISAKNYVKGSTTKYWRELVCLPQTVELKTWSTNHPYFILKGTVVDSHDAKELGTEMEVNIQSYNFLLQESIDAGIYAINE